MRQPHLIAVAKFVRDLLSHSEKLIKFDRSDAQEKDFNTNYIVINGSGVENKQGSGKTYDSDNETMSYNEAMMQSVVIEFYGDDAYTNARKLSLLNNSQSASDLKRTLGISISHVSNIIDVKQVLGSAYGNRVHVEMNVNYCPSIEVETLRIDTAEFEFIED